MSAAIAMDARVREALPRILRGVREPAKVIALRAGCAARTIEALRQDEHGVSVGTLLALAHEYPQVRALVSELMGEVERDPGLVLDQITKLVSRVRAG